MKTIPIEPSTKGRILVVDDEPLNRELLRDLLELNGYTVLEATDGLSALKMVDSGTCDVILLDVRMPGISGYTCVAALRRLQPGLACAVMSGLDAGEVSEVLPDGVLWLSKPFTVADVRALVGSLQAG